MLLQPFGPPWTKTQPRGLAAATPARISDRPVSKSNRHYNSDLLSTALEDTKESLLRAVARGTLPGSAGTSATDEGGAGVPAPGRSAAPKPVTGGLRGRQHVAAFLANLKGRGCRTPALCSRAHRGCQRAQSCGCGAGRRCRDRGCNSSRRPDGSRGRLAGGSARCTYLYRHPTEASRLFQQPSPTLGRELRDVE